MNIFYIPPEYEFEFHILFLQTITLANKWGLLIFLAAKWEGLIYGLFWINELEFFFKYQKYQDV